MNDNKEYRGHDGQRFIDGDFISNAVSANFSGRFKGQEVKDLGQAFIRHIVAARGVALFFGQQINFRLTSLPENFEQIGGQRAFILYNSKEFQANDELQYRHFLRDLEMKGRLPKYFLPESNYSLCKLKSKIMPDVAMIAMSWVTDETKELLKCLNLLRKLLSFAANLCAVEEMPVIIGCSLRLSLDDIKQVVYNEFEGFRCYGYVTDKPRRAQRMCDVFISCPPLRLHDVKPVVSGKIEIASSNRMIDKSWRNPEDAFYWDPVFATMLLRTDASSLLSLATSPRALTPTPSSTFDFLDDETVPTADEVEISDDNTDTWRMYDQLKQAPPIERMTNNDGQSVGQQSDSAEETLRELLIESNRIKEMVSEAEMKARNWLQTKTFSLVEDKRAGHQVTCDDTVDSSKNEVQHQDETVDESAAVSDDEQFVDGGDQGCNDNRTIRFRQRPATITVAPSGESMQQAKQTCSSPLKTVPSYVDLYNEELIETNKRCYMQ